MDQNAAITRKHLFPKRSAKMIDGTEKPQFPLKFAKHTVRHNEFGYNFPKKDRRTLCYGTD